MLGLMEGLLNLLLGHLLGGLALELLLCMMTMKLIVEGLRGNGSRMGEGAGSVEIRGTCQHLEMGSLVESMAWE